MTQKKKLTLQKTMSGSKAAKFASMLLVVGMAGGLYYRSIHLKSSAATPYSVTGYRIYGSGDTPFPDGVGTTSLGNLSTSSNPFSYGTSGGDNTISSSSSITYNGIKYNFDHSLMCYSNDVPRCPGGASISYSQPRTISNPGSYADVWFSYAAERPAVVVQANNYQGSIIVGYNSALTISWGSSNATSCNASGDWSGAKTTSGGSENHNSDTTSPGSKNYSLTCQGPGGSTTSSVSVTVQSPPSPTPNPTPTPTPTPNPTPTPSPTPNPTPTPNPSPSPSPSPSPVSTPVSGQSNLSQTPSSTPTLQGGNASRQAAATPQVSVIPDTAPPTSPSGFSANPNPQSTSIALSWQPATDNIGVQSYQLERSTDQQAWNVISNTTTDTTYNDQNVRFQTHYFYRIQAKDAAGNSSEYVTADALTNGFSGNVKPDQETTLVSAQDNLKVTLPAGAVSEAASCSIETSSIDNSPTIKGYGIVRGPFNVLCKKADSTAITSFNKPLTVEWSITPPKSISGPLVYYGHDQEWSKLDVATHNAKSHTDSFVLGKGTTFVAMGKLKTTPALVKVLVILIGLFSVVAVVIYVLLRQKRLREQAIIDDYRHKMTGI